MEIAVAPFPRASRKPASVSAVSPDCEMGMQRVPSSTTGSRYRYSEPRSTSTGRRASPSIMNLPTSAACHEVPQATTSTFRSRRSCSSGSGRVSKKTSPVSGSILPASVSRMARGCSWISFNMKWRYPPFSAITGDQSMCCGARVRGFPSKSNRDTPRGVATIISPSSRKRAFRVWESSGGRSDARKISPSPTPATIGQLRRTPTSVPGSFSEIARKA